MLQVIGNLHQIILKTKEMYKKTVLVKIGAVECFF